MAADFGISITEKLFETIGNAIIKEVCDMWGYKSQLEGLEETVSTIRKVLLDAEAKRELSNEEQDYIGKLKDAVYDADDLFDEFLTLAELKQHSPQSKHSNLFEKVRCFFSSKNQLGQAYRMSHDVKKIRKKLDGIVDSHTKFGFSVDNKPISRRPEETCSYIEEKEIIGREKDKDTIIDMLLDNNVAENFHCLTIVGVGGLGKTTLAQLVYNDEKVKREFDLRLWVCVSDQEGAQFDVRIILCKILESLTDQKVDGILTMQLVHNQLLERLRGQKYLIVLDDVWNEERDKWLNLKQFLMSGQVGSKIVVTTRSERTGTIINENNLYRLKCLSDEESWLLFEMSAFNRELKHENHHEFVEIGMKIVEKCSNNPLAIKVVGSLLFGQDIIKWRSFVNSGLAEIGQSDAKIFSILRLSYHSLALSLKSCFSYCAVFPKGCRLRKEMLISLWMAQGYIMPLDGGQSLEDAAEEHFLILLRRCFFQEAEKDGYGYESVKIHDLMHDVAQQVGKEEIRVVTSSFTNSMKDKICHVQYVGDSHLETLSCSSKIRTLISSKCHINLVVTQIDKWKSLRVLTLRGLVNLPDSIGKLIHLRYLDMSDNYRLEVLPNAITKLHNLQTLLLSHSGIRELPKDFCKLVKLRHLDLTFCLGLSGMPSGMDKLTSLKVLPWFVVGKKVSSDAKRDDELRPLKALTGIRGEIRIIIEENYRKVEGMDDKGGGYLKGMKDITTVFIDCDSLTGHGWDDLECQGVLETLEPPSNIKKLILSGYEGTMIPKWGRAVDNWANFVSCLVAIDLCRCQNLQELPVLSKLPFLKKLILWDFDNLEYVETSTDLQASELEMFFPSLVLLKLIRMKKLKGWWRGVDDDSVHHMNITVFPCLSNLSIYDCPNLTSFPPCPSLETLDFRKNNEALRITGKEDDNVVTAKSFQLSLGVDNLNHLKSHRIDCLKELSIHGDQEALDFTTEEFQSCASILQSLGFRDMNSVKRLHVGRGLKHFTALKTLEMVNVIPRFSIEDDSLFWTSFPQNLRTLELRDLEETSLPKGMQYLTSLSNLQLFQCYKLEGVPDWIDCLSSLQSLHILTCPAIKSIPESMRNLTSLQRLEIYQCPDLTQRCTEPHGEDLPKIRHIPHIELPDNW